MASKIIRCVRCQREYFDGMIARCGHPAVRKAYGGNNICYYCCKRCKHHERVELIGGIKCGYESEAK